MSSSKQNPRDKQPGQTGKGENDSNKMGEQDPTQQNQSFFQLRYQLLIQ